MKLCIALLLVFTLGVSASSIAQKERLNISKNNISLEELFKEIQSQTDLSFVFNSSTISSFGKLNVMAVNKTVKEVLDGIFADSKFSYRFHDDIIIIYPKPKNEKTAQDKRKYVKGKVTDKKGNPLPQVTVVIKGTTIGVPTNMDGKYIINIPAGEQIILVYSFVGMKTVEVKYKGQKSIDVVLEEDAEELDDVIVNGYFTQKKESFTGNATVVTGEQIKTMGNQNILKSLSLLDPSLRVVDDNAFGSDPNKMPKIRLRGEAILTKPGFESIDRSNLTGDPNLPLFILDNFETTIEKILDLDMNRVESVTILKDAAATAIYGSRAANGIILVKTKQPEEGELKVSYGLSTDFNFPDLGSYDLLNGKELIDFQKQIDIYGYIGSKRDATLQIDRYIAEGVNTDWLSQPVRNAVGHKHSLNLMGGDKSMRYGFDLSYANNPGVMKGSSRNTVSIGVSLAYNLNDKLLFRNRLTVDKNSQKNSLYGSFDSYASMPEYFPLYGKDGQITPSYEYYDASGNLNTFSRNNPLYDTTVGNKNTASYTNINENFSLEWRISNALKLTSNIAYTQLTSETNVFTSPLAMEFLNSSSPEDRGRYTYTTTKSEKYYGNMVLSYSKGFSGHFINTSVGVNISENKGTTQGFVARGFSENSPADPAFAMGYEEGGAPISAESTSRLFGLLASFNYSYKSRYLLDASYRLDGSSMFGSDDKTSGFYSFGLGWNIHNEEFLKDSYFINMLKLRATSGETGAVNFSPYQSKTMVTYFKEERYTGESGTKIKGLGNNSLRWQTTINNEFGIQFGLLNNLLSGNLSVYKKETQDMVVPITTPYSAGFSSYTANLGAMENKGYEFSLRGNIINKENLRMSLFLSAVHNESKILAISNSFETFNELSNNSGLDDSADPNAIAAVSHNFLVRVEEGKSNTAIYAVRSLGIDPISGREMFLTKDGEMTFEWDGKDKVVVGDTEPDLSGTFGTSIAYKNLNVSLTFSYNFGGQLYNTTLLSKVENTDKYSNMDRRVLEETWQKPGDIAKHRLNLLGFTPASSRLVQDNDVLKLSSVNINYDVPANIYKRFSMASMRLSFNMNDICYWSKVKIERGTNYPYAKAFSVSLQANF